MDFKEEIWLEGRVLFYRKENIDRMGVLMGSNMRRKCDFEGLIRLHLSSFVRH